MRAIVLAAGRGTRLRSATDQPKCLFAPGGRALLDRYITVLDALGIPATVVVGYREDAVRKFLAALRPKHPPTIVANPDYQLGSILSLARALEVVEGSVLLMDGDVLFHPDLLARLADAPHENTLLVDSAVTFSGEEYMAGVDRGRVAALRRADVQGHERAGEWVGFARLSAAAVRALKAEVTAQVASGATAGGYEDALASLLGAHDFRSVDASDLPWIEIDFPEDAERAEAIVRTDPRW